MTAAEDIAKDERTEAPEQEAQDSAPANESDGAELEAARARIAELEAQVAELEGIKDEVARARADLYNYRTRVERDREKDRQLAGESACRDLLPVLDNLNRTLSAVDDKGSQLYKGVAMVQKMFLQAMNGLGLTTVPTDGAFDPKIHEAMGTVEVDDDEMDGRIVEVMTDGYRLGGKLIRAALVKVGEKRGK